MDVLAQVTEFVGVPAWGLLPVALVAAVVLFVVFDALSHVVLKPFKSPPVPFLLFLLTFFLRVCSSGLGGT